MTLIEIMATREFGFVFMALLIGSVIWALFYEIFFNQGQKIEVRKGVPY